MLSNGTVRLGYQNILLHSSRPPEVNENSFLKAATIFMLLCQAFFLFSWGDLPPLGLKL
jgi:hypothetical protein